MESINKNNFFEALAQQSAEGVTVADEEGNYVYVNPTFCEMIGYSEAELLNMSVFDVKSKNQDKTSFSRTKTSKEGLPVQVYLQRKDGSEFYSEVLGKVIDLGDETVILGIIRDITDYLNHDDERLILERQMQHTQKLESLGVLAGGIAHDFNNLLMVILGNADLALAEMSESSSSRINVAEIVKASLRAAELAKQMLAYSGKGQFLVKPITLAELVHEIAHLLEVSISKKVTLNYNFQEDIPSFNGDVTQIRQVIMNLITNASESIGDEVGAISLSTGTMNCDRKYLDSTESVINGSIDGPLEEGLYTYIQVSDTGCGMDQAVISRIFDPFFTTKFTGRGLGMSAVQGIIRGHSGAIKVDSEVGKGTTFTVLFLPNDISVEAPSTDDNVMKENSKKLLSGTVLFVDDEKMVCDVATKMLESLGLDVLIAYDGQEAIHILQKQQDKISCVLLDLMMPEMDGKQTLAMMKEMNMNIPVILCSGYSETDATQSFNDDSLAGFLQKPFDLSLLNKMLEKVLINE